MLDIVVWLFVLILWQQLLVVRGICLQRTVRVTVCLAGPYLVLDFIFLLLSGDSVFLHLFFATQAMGILLSCVATVHTHRALSKFLSAVQGETSETLNRIAFSLRMMTGIAGCVLLFFLIVLFFGDQRNDNCGDVVSRRPHLDFFLLIVVFTPQMLHKGLLGCVGGGQHFWPVELLAHAVNNFSLEGEKIWGFEQAARTGFS
jgi:hypothetical protein